ncbi:unnamed protein product [Camellia sinensis]
MAKAVALLALCVLAFATIAQSHEEVFNIEGKVYCDTCRVMFPTRVTQYLEGAEVELRCRAIENGTVTYSVSGRSGAGGCYSLKVHGDHQDEICDVVVVSSPDPSCNEIVSEIDSTRLCLTHNSGIESAVRYANPIGFVKTEALTDCAEVLDELSFVPIELQH